MARAGRPGSYDTFDTNPVEGHKFAGQEEGFFDKVKLRFADCPRVRLVKGFLPESFADGRPEQVACLHIGLSNAAGELAALDRLFDRVVSGGIVVMDDYEWAGIYRERKKQEDPWFAARGYRVFPLPTGQGFIVRR